MIINRFLFSLALFSFPLLQAAPEVVILKTENVVCSINKQGWWLERYLDVPKRIVNSPFELASKSSNKMFFLNTIINNYPYKKFSRYQNSIFCTQSVFETDEIPKKWVHDFNRYFDFITVPDPYLVEVYQNSGVKVPIFLVPQGTLLEDWLDLKPIEKEKGPFVFLASGSLYQPRKNHDILIQAFQQAFPGRDDVQLIIQARGPKTKKYLQRAKDLIKKTGVNEIENIIFHYGDLNDREYKELFLSCDCLVNISGGEGFSITPREALAVGIPAIVTNNTAQTTICESGFVCSVPCEVKIQAFYHNHGFIGHQYNPTVEAVKEALLDMYHNYPDYKKLAQDARPWVEQYTVKHLLPLWRQLLCPKKVLYGDRDEVTENYLMTNSESLYKKLCKHYPH